MAILLKDIGDRWYFTGDLAAGERWASPGMFSKPNTLVQSKMLFKHSVLWKLRLKCWVTHCVVLPGAFQNVASPRDLSEPEPEKVEARAFFSAFAALRCSMWQLTEFSQPHGLKLPSISADRMQVEAMLLKELPEWWEFTCDRVDVRSDKKNVSKRMFCQAKEVLMIQRGHEDGNRRFSLVPCNFTQLWLFIAI